MPLVVLAAGAAASFAAAPHLASSFRRFDRSMVFVGVASAVMLAATTPAGGIISLLVGAAAAAIVHLALGASAGRPTVSEVTDALADLGIAASDMALAAQQAGGVVAFEAADGRGDRLRVKVYGRDARDAQLLARVWRGLWYRGSSRGATSRLQQVEHEAFVTLFASSQGLRVPTVVAAGRDARHDSLIVVGDSSDLLEERPQADIVGALADIWHAVGGLHELGLAHGDLATDSFGLEGGAVVLRDLSAATFRDGDGLRQRDLAQTLVLSAVLVGIERAVIAAVDELGSSGVEAMLPYLQNAALGSVLRRRVKADAFDMDALRSGVAGAAEVEVPDVAELRRVRPQALVTVALIALVAFAFITTLGNVDLSELLDELRSAVPGWLLAALVVGQLPFISQAIATRGACPRPVALGPLALLESGIAFVALAVPSTAGRLALDIRFFQRQGLPASSAVSIAAVDGFSGFLVQISVLILTLGFGVGDVELNFTRSGSGETGSGSADLVIALGIFALVVVLLLAVALAVPRSADASGTGCDR